MLPLVAYGALSLGRVVACPKNAKAEGEEKTDTPAGGDAAA